jgi:hypothetical protein
MPYNRYTVPVRSRLRFLLGLAACLCLVALPLGGGALGATSSGANGDIAFVHGGDVYLVSTGTALVAGATDPSWSPNGLKLAFVQGGAIKTCTVSSCAPAATGATGTQPVWSPDGLKIAYVSGSNIHVWTLAGSTDIDLAQAGTDPSWSSDGTQIVFTQGGAIARMPSASAGSVTFITTTGVSGSSQPAWSPDGSSIAFQSSSSGHNHIYVVSAPSGGSVTQVTSVSTDDETAPSWSPDSTEIVYANASLGIRSVAKAAGGGWGVPVVHTSTATDLTPDRQTVAPSAGGTAPSITGGAAPQTGQLLNATNGSWSGASTFAYQWRRCDSAGNNCSDIGGATGSSYAVVSADVGGRLRVVVTATNAAGSTASSPSSATGVVTAAGVVNPPVSTAYPVISFGTGNSAPVVGVSSTTSAGTWSGSAPITFKYQWKWCSSATSSCFDIPGATFFFYTVSATYYGKVLRVQVTATNSAASVAQNSEATPAVTAIAPKLRATPQIVGENVVDQTLSLAPGTWDGSPAPTFTYSWRRCNPVGDIASCVQIPGATLATYVPTVADVGFSMRVWITGGNQAGSDVAVTNHTFPIVDKQHFSPSAVTVPAIAGDLVVGRQLTASIGTFDGDSPIATTLAWQRCDAIGAGCHSIPGATKVVYYPTASDLGAMLRLAVTAKNAYGTIVSLSDPSEPVVASPPRRRGRRIVGTERGDYLAGGGFDDVILGLGGNDTLLGGAGVDLLDGGPGNDVLFGGPGADRILGGPGSDTIYAVDGERDVIDCGAGADRAVVDPVDIVKNCEIVQKVTSPSPSPNPSPPSDQTP